MPDPKKQSTVDQIVEILKDLVTQPVTDQSSSVPTPAGVRRVKRSMKAPRRKTAAKPRPKAAAKKKKRATTARKTTRRKVSSKKKTARK